MLAYIRREGHSLREAEDLTQEFFHRLLAAESFGHVSAEKGRFSSWLIGALKHFLLNEWQRGSGIAALSLDAMEPGERAACEPRDEETPDLAYDRRWAELAVVQH